MRVHSDLQQSADDLDPRAVGMVMGWSFDVAGRIGGHPEPGAHASRYISRVIESELTNLGRGLRAAATYQGEVAARSLDVRTLVMAGERDRMVAPREVEALSKIISGATFSSIAGAGHFLMIEAPDEVRLALSTFLAET
jgi:pimeloyl-ACP methyl ester carboxylesterase